MTPVVSIVVPTYRRPEPLARCLASIAATVDVPHEVLCVSVAGDDATDEVIAGHDARHLVQPERGGAVQAMNLGFRAARGAYVTQVNDDCELLPYSVSNAVRFLETPAHAGVGQAAFFHDSPVRRNVHAEITVEGVRYVVCHVRGLCYANFGLVRRDLAARLGFLDERYFIYGADPDFSLKVWHEAGLAVAPCPGALIHHLELDDERGARE
ncbi:MAG: glycosyltransferase family 2 protein, partial [Planctomycetota bacterium]